MGRRGLLVAVLLCAAGAAVALLAARNTWAVEVTPRPAPFPAERTELTGGDQQPWVPALAWVALAGAGALLATRAAVRRAVGVLLVLCGAGIAVAAAGTIAAPEVSAGWPVLAASGGLAAAGAGVLAVTSGHRWPAMGGRYQRRSRAPVPDDGNQGKAPDQGNQGKAPDQGNTEKLWDALDRGEDPTG